jgi:hypothetical protein
MRTIDQPIDTMLIIFGENISKFKNDKAVNTSMQAATNMI